MPRRDLGVDRQFELAHPAALPPGAKMVTDGLCLAHAEKIAARRPIAMTSEVIDRIPGRRLNAGSFNTQEVAMTALPQVSTEVSTPAGSVRDMSLIRAALLV